MSERYTELLGKRLFLDGRQIVFKNEKGFYISVGGKLFFPHCSFTDVSEGFVKNFKVVDDCGGYAFFTGEMVTSSWSTEEMHEFIVKRGQTFLTYYTLNYGGVNAVMEVGDNTNNIYIDWSFFCKAVPQSTRQYLKQFTLGIELPRG